MTKTAIVTGAASGIGHCIASNLAQDNYQVIAIDRNHTNFSNNITFIQLDLMHEDKLKQIISELDRLDVAVNCAGVSACRKDLTEFSSAEIVQQWQSNFNITFNALK